MITPLQLTVPEGAQVHIHLGSLAQLAGGIDGPLPLHGAPVVTRVAETAERPKHHPLRLAMAGLLLFGTGYAARTFTAANAVAQGPQATSLYLPPAPAFPGPPPSALLGSAVPALPPGIRATPPTPPFALPTAEAAGSVARGPFPAPASPALPQAAGPAAARSSFGLE